MLSLEALFNVLLYGIFAKEIIRFGIRRLIKYIRHQLNDPDNNPRNFAIYNHYQENALGGGHTASLEQCQDGSCVILSP